MNHQPPTMGHLDAISLQLLAQMCVLCPEVPLLLKACRNGLLAVFCGWLLQVSALYGTCDTVAKRQRKDQGS